VTHATQKNKKAKGRRKVRTDPLHLRNLRREKLERENSEIRSKGPYAVYQCGRHPEAAHVSRAGLVPPELVCIHCRQRVQVKVRETLVDKDLLRRLLEARG
jgi:hypothetical protein